MRRERQQEREKERERERRAGHKEQGEVNSLFGLSGHIVSIRSLDLRHLQDIARGFFTAKYLFALGSQLPTLQSCLDDENSGEIS